MRYLTNDTNLVADATLAATNIVASQAFELTARDAEGGGIVSLTGAYTGSDDAVFDIEVTSTTINGAPQISAPVFAGVGLGMAIVSRIAQLHGADLDVHNRPEGGLEVSVLLPQPPAR